MHWLVVVNTDAGRKQTDTARIQSGIDARRIEATLVETRDLTAAHEAVLAAAAGGVTHFVAVGGDGSVHHLLNSVMDADVAGRPVIAAIAEGSGSDFVRTFGHDTGVDASLDRLIDPDLYRIDIGHVVHGGGASYFLNALNSGVAAASVGVADAMPRGFGGLRYTSAFWVALAKFHQAQVSVAIDHHQFAGDAINIVVANGQFFGGGLNVAPRATLVDGDFDVQVFSGHRRTAFTVMPRLAFGNHLSHRAVRRYIGGDVEIRVPGDWPLEADGELLGRGPATISMRPAAVDFVI